MAFPVLLQTAVLCIFAYIQINEGLDPKAATPSTQTKIGLNVTSFNFMQPIMSKISKLSSVVTNFVRKKFDEMRIIYAGLAGATPGVGPLRAPGDPVMQVSRPLAAPVAPRRTADVQFQATANKTR